MMKNPSRKAILTYAILVLAILLLDLCFAYPSLHFSYEPQGETVDLFSAYYSYSLNTEFDEESLYFTQSGDDPQLYLTDMEQTLGGITISLAEPLDSDMRVEVFYQTTEMPGLSARKSVVTTLYTGERSCNVKLPLHTYHSLRLDLDGSYQLDSITGCSGTMKKTPVLNGTFFLVLLKWLPLSIPAVLLIFLAHRDRYQKTGTLVKSLFVLPENGTRNHGYDFLRVLAALMVISMHACRNALAEMAMEGVGYHFVNILFLTALSCNTLYMMLSGALLLQDRQETVLHFYARRFGKVVIPLLCYYVLFLDFNQVFDDSLWDGIRVSLQMILSGAPGFAPQFWLVYTLIALYLFTPFLRKMLKILNTQMLQTLVLLILILNLLTSYLPLLGISFGVTSSLASWLGAYILGYFMTTKEAARNNRLYLHIGVFCLLLSILMAYTIPENIAYISNCVPTTLFICCALFALVHSCESFFAKPHRILGFFSRYSYSIILVHWYILFVVVESHLGITPTRARVFGGTLATILLTFLLSAAYGFVFENLVILPLQYVWNRFCGWVENRTKQA